MTRIALVADGNDWERWESLNFTTSLDRIAGTLSAVGSDPARTFDAGWTIRSGGEFGVLIDRDEAFRGFATLVESAKDARGLRVEALGRMQSIATGGHEGPWFWPQGTTGEDIARQVLAPYGIDVTFDVPLITLPVEGLRVGPTESPHAILRQVADYSGTLLWADGARLRFGPGIRLEDPPVSLEQCHYTSARTESRSATRYSKIVVKWQRANFNNSDDDLVQTQEIVWEDPSAPRYLPLVLLESGPDQAEARIAKLLAERTIGDTITMRCTVQSLRRPDGLLWRVGQRVDVDDPELGVRDRLVVHEIGASITEDAGDTVGLGLRSASAYGAGATSLEAFRSGDLFGPVVTQLGNIESEIVIT